MWNRQVDRFQVVRARATDLNASLELGRFWGHEIGFAYWSLSSLRIDAIGFHRDVAKVLLFLIFVGRSGKDAAGRTVVSPQTSIFLPFYRLQ